MTDQHERADHEAREITVETLSAPPLRIMPASLVMRIAAGLVDSTILALAGIVFVLVTGENVMAPTGLFTLTLIAYQAVFSFAYYLILEALFGATLGKAILRLRVLGKDGELCSFAESFKRNILRFIDWLPLFYIMGVAVILSSKNSQRIGDRIAGTTVTRAPEKDINPPPAPFLFH